MRKYRLAIGVALACLVTGSLRAQRLEVGIGAGPALPIRQFHETSRVGLMETGNIKLQLGEHPVALRLDAVHGEFAGRATRSFIYPRTRVTGVSANAEYDFDGGEGSRWRGWGFGGLGGSYTITDRGVPEFPTFGRTYLGLQGGVGGAYRMGLLNPFIEFRYLLVFRSNSAVKTFPLLIGIRFGRRSEY